MGDWECWGGRVGRDYPYGISFIFCLGKCVNLYMPHYNIHNKYKLQQLKDKLYKYKLYMYALMGVYTHRLIFIFGDSIFVNSPTC